MAQPEERLQIRCAMFCTSHVVAPCEWTAIEHGRKHSGSKEQRAREWQRLARKGVKKGLSDLWFIMPGYLFCCELKWGRNTETDEQERLGAKLQAMGHGYSVARSVEQLGEKLVEHGIPVGPGWRLAAQRHDAALDGEAPARKKPARKFPQKPTARQVAAGNRAAMVGVVR
jgi:hypothetical protein